MTLRILITLVIAACCGACAGGPGAEPNLEPQQCVAGETFVCYGGQATRLDTESYDPRFCRCEKSVQRL